MTSPRDTDRAEPPVHLNEGEDYENAAARYKQAALYWKAKHDALATPQAAKGAPTDLSDERAAFEKQFEGAAAFWYEKHGEREYRKPYDELWNGWQARAALKSESPEPDAAAELIDIARAIEGLKLECGMDPESPRATQNLRYMSIAYRVRALATRGVSQVSKPLSVDPAVPASEEKT